MVLGCAGWGASAARKSPSPGQELRLWPGSAPGSSHLNLTERVVDSGGPADPQRTISQIDVPTILAYLPARPNRTAAVIIPGGGYKGLVIDTGHRQRRHQLCLRRAANRVTTAPNALATCTAYDPTPPAAPMTSTFCPGWTLPASRTAIRAVPPEVGTAAACSKLRFAGVTKPLVGARSDPRDMSVGPDQHGSRRGHGT
jgi:hypothetical protein